MTSNLGQNIRLELIDTIPQLELHEAEWDNLSIEAPQRLPMLSHAWVSSYFEHRLSLEDKWFCLFAYQDDRLVGVLPVVNTPGRLYGVRYSYLRTPRDLHTRSGDILVGNGSERLTASVFKRLITEAVRACPPTLCLEIDGVRANSLTVYYLRRNRTKAVLMTRPDFGGSLVKVDGTFKSFAGRLRKNFAGNLRKARNKLSKIGPVELEIIRGAEATVEHLPRFMSLEASGWKGEEGTAILCSPNDVNFYHTLVRRLSAKGWLEWHFLNSGGRTIAGQMAVRFGDALLLLKIAYDEAFSACAPGNILFEKTVETVFGSEGVKEINCLTDMPWHQNWQMEISKYFNLFIYPYGAVSLLGGALPRLFRAAVRRIPGL